MAHQVVWTKIILETFLEESGLNDRVSMGDNKARILEGIMRTRCAGKTIVEQAEMLALYIILSANAITNSIFDKDF